MRKSLGSVLLTLASAGLAIGLTATSAAAAAKTWSATPGGKITGKAGTTTFTDTTAGLAVTCTSSDLTGTLKKGKGLPGAGLGTVTKVTFNDCTVDGLSLSVSSGAVKWPLNAVSYKSGVTSGTMTGIHIAINSSECKAVIDGTSGSAHNGKVDVTYTNKTHTLKILGPGDNLHLWDVKGACSSAVHNGDAGTLTSSYVISPAQTITES